MTYRADNAIIMAAGMSSRFAPLSYETPKALLEVKGEVLIERQIKQLKDVGISEIIIVVGYKKEQFLYLADKYDVKIVENPYYNTRNNHSSIYVAKDYLKNTYICSSDNYFTKNPFELEVECAYYSAVYSEDWTTEWCLDIDDDDIITSVSIGGNNKWYMIGHAFWTENFSNKILSFIEEDFETQEIRRKFWEDIYIEHIEELDLKIKKYPSHFIFEFDTLDELRTFDKTYWNNSKSNIMRKLASTLECEEKDIFSIIPMNTCQGEAIGFTFLKGNQLYCYKYENGEIEICAK